MEQITLLSDQVLPTDVPENAVRDHEDRAILACAVGGKADCIVTGNRDLLVLSSYEGISILNVQQCLALLDSA
jgi:putative PIN family toxin of toxin-antitoxin system